MFLAFFAFSECFDGWRYGPYSGFYGSEDLISGMEVMLLFEHSWVWLMGISDESSFQLRRAPGDPPKPSRCEIASW